MKKFFSLGSLLLAGLVVAVILAGCASTQTYDRPETEPPDKEADKFLILPVDINLPGNELAQEAAVFGGLIAAFEDTGIPLQPLKPAMEAASLGGFSRNLAYGIQHMVTVHNTFDFAEDAALHGGTSEYEAILVLVGTLLDVVNDALKPDFKIKYIVIASVQNQGAGTIPETRAYKVLGAIYNIEDAKIDKVIIYEATTADEEAALLAEMGGLGQNIYDLLFPEE